MIKKTIKYTDFEGETHEEDFWFHIQKKRLVDLQFSRPGGLEKVLPAMLEAAQRDDAKELLDLFTEMVRMSYGIRTDAAHFLAPTDEELRMFLGSQAFDALWAELATDEKALTEFTLGILPEDMRGPVKKELESGNIPAGLRIAPLPASDDPAWIREDRDPTPKELQSMTKAQLAAALRRKSSRNQGG